jgi:hypothetical protein
MLLYLYRVKPYPTTLLARVASEKKVAMPTADSCAPPVGPDACTRLCCLERAERLRIVPASLDWDRPASLEYQSRLV